MVEDTNRMFVLFGPVIYSNDHTHPTSHVAETSFYANFKVLLPICLSLLVLLGLIAVVLIIRKRSKCDQTARWRVLYNI